MILSSSVFNNYGNIPTEYTCNGKGANPPLFIAQVPEEAKNLVLIVDDPDAPNGIFTHWLVWNIDPKTKEIKEGTIPQSATVGKNSLGKNSYQAPCPPSGTHHYRFMLSAFDAAFDLPVDTTRDKFAKYLTSKNALARAELVGKYTANK